MKNTISSDISSKIMDIKKNKRIKLINVIKKNYSFRNNNQIARYNIIHIRNNKDNINYNS